MSAPRVSTCDSVIKLASNDVIRSISLSHAVPAQTPLPNLVPVIPKYCHPITHNWKMPNASHHLSLSPLSLSLSLSLSPISWRSCLANDELFSCIDTQQTMTFLSFFFFFWFEGYAPSSTAADLILCDQPERPGRSVHSRRLDQRGRCRAHPDRRWQCQQEVRHVDRRPETHRERGLSHVQDHPQKKERWRIDEGQTDAEWNPSQRRGNKRVMMSRNTL